MKTVYLAFSLFLIFSCSVNNQKDSFEDAIKSKVSNGVLGGYIHPDSSYNIIPGNCLNNIISSLDSIVFSANSSTEKVTFGLNFYPKSVLNINEIRSIEHAKWLAFERMTISNVIDTTYYVEVYVYESINNEFIPCYLKDNGSIYVDSLISITPNLSTLKGNCILEVTDLELPKGIWQKVDENHNVIDTNSK